MRDAAALPRGSREGGRAASGREGLIMAWPTERRLIGKPIERIDGPLKVSGRAKYSADRDLPGLLHAKIYRSPLAHARIKGIDLSAVEAMPGVRAIQSIKEEGATVFYIGDEILAIAAESEEIARDAIRAVRVELEAL